MIDITYDPDADAAYISLANGRIESTREAGPFSYDVDADGKVLGIEILFCRNVLAAGDWMKSARLLPRSGSAAAE